MLKQGKKMCYKGHNHSTGCYFDISYAEGYDTSKIGPQLVEHNGDGSIYSANVNILDCGLFYTNKTKKISMKKTWIVARPDDFGLTEFPKTLRKNVIQRQPKIKDKTVIKWFWQRKE